MKIVATISCSYEKLFKSPKTSKGMHANLMQDIMRIGSLDKQKGTWGTGTNILCVSKA